MFVYSCLFVFLLEPCSFLKKNRGEDFEGRDDGEEVGRIERGRTVVREYCMKEESVFIFINRIICIRVN